MVALRHALVAVQEIENDAGINLLSLFAKSLWKYKDFTGDCGASPIMNASRMARRTYWRDFVSQVHAAARTVTIPPNRASIIDASRAQQQQ